MPLKLSPVKSLPLPELGAGLHPSVTRCREFWLNRNCRWGRLALAVEDDSGGHRFPSLYFWALWKLSQHAFINPEPPFHCHFWYFYFFAFILAFLVGLSLLQNWPPALRAALEVALGLGASLLVLSVWLWLLFWSYRVTSSMFYGILFYSLRHWIHSKPLCYPVQTQKEFWSLPLKSVRLSGLCFVLPFVAFCCLFFGSPLGECATRLFRCWHERVERFLSEPDCWRR